MLVGLLLLLTACSPTEEETPVTPLDAWGPWTVGTHEDIFTSTAGLATPVQVWYPTLHKGSLTHLYDALVAGEALEGAEPACDERRPVLVFSHGNGGVRYQSFFFTEHLASHGFVVVASDHVGNTFLDFGTAEVEDLVFRRPVDVADTFDWLIAGSGLEDCVEADAGYALSGHSFGGYTTLATAGGRIHIEETATWCAEYDDWLCDAVARFAQENPDLSVVDLSDDRVWAAVPMAPAGHEALVGGLAEIGVPTVVLGGEMDTLTSMAEQVQPIYNGLGVSPRHLGVLERADHFTFSNACDILSTYQGCGGESVMANELAHPLINGVTTAFLFDQLGDATAGEDLPPQDSEWTWTGE